MKVTFSVLFASAASASYLYASSYSAEHRPSPILSFSGSPHHHHHTPSGKRRHSHTHGTGTGTAHSTAAGIVIGTGTAYSKIAASSTADLYTNSSSTAGGNLGYPTATLTVIPIPSSSASSLAGACVRSTTTLTIATTLTIYPSSAISSVSVAASSSAAALSSTAASLPSTSAAVSSVAGIETTISSSAAASSTSTSVSYSPTSLATPKSITATSTAAATASTASSRATVSAGSPWSVTPPHSFPINKEYQQHAISIIETLATTYSNESKVWTHLWGYQAATIYQDLMDYQFWTGSSSQESYAYDLLDIVTDKNLMNGVGATDDYNDDREWWMLALIHGYRSYGNVALLNEAITMFKFVVASSQLSAADSGTTPTLGGVKRSTQIPADCDVAGSVYWRQTPDSSINAVSTGLVAHVGALLYGITKEEEYRTAADLALNFERRRLLSSTGIMNVDSITTATCKNNGGDLSYNTGIYLAALTQLYQATGEAKYLEWATLTATTSVTGVFGNSASAPLVLNQNGGQDVFFRCLNEFYAMLVSQDLNTELQAKIKTFVQANVDAQLSRANANDAFTAAYLAKSADNSWGLGGMFGVVFGAMIML